MTVVERAARVIADCILDELLGTDATHPLEAPEFEAIAISLRNAGLLVSDDEPPSDPVLPCQLPHISLRSDL